MKIHLFKFRLTGTSKNLIKVSQIADCEYVTHLMWLCTVCSMCV